VGIPISREGTLQVSYWSNDSVRVYLKNQQKQNMMNELTIGNSQFAVHMSYSMGVIELAIVNPLNSTVAISHLTCILKP
jgi:hypothetical protein